MSDVHARNKARIAAFSAALRAGEPAKARKAVFELFAEDAHIQLGQPFGRLTGARELWERVYAPLLTAMPDMERRDFIRMSGPRWNTDQPSDWVGVGGNLVGQLSEPWLGIPATPMPVFMRYHEYFRMKDGRIVEMLGLWDLAQIMLQAGVWRMPTQAGVEWMCPGPGTGDGVSSRARDPDLSTRSIQQVWDMLQDVKKGTRETPGSGLGGHWDSQANWYGPTGLGTARGHAEIAGKIFSQFRSGLSNNTRHLDAGVFFGDGALVAFAGWPSGTAVHSGDGFLGVPTSGATLQRCSLDFWSIENGLIRECWVLIDVIDLYLQMGLRTEVPGLP